MVICSRDREAPLGAGEPSVELSMDRLQYSTVLVSQGYGVRNGVKSEHEQWRSSRALVELSFCSVLAQRPCLSCQGPSRHGLGCLLASCASAPPACSSLPPASAPAQAQASASCSRPLLIKARWGQLPRHVLVVVAGGIVTRSTQPDCNAAISRSRYPRTPK